MNIAVRVLFLLATAGAMVMAAGGRAEAGGHERSGRVLLGAAFQHGLIESNPTYTTQLLSHGYAVLTPEWEQYMDQVQASQGVYDFSKPDAMLEFAENSDLQLRAMCSSGVCRCPHGSRIRRRRGRAPPSWR
jgi:GH35 family endo-1,4-beta-xylanase